MRNPCRRPHWRLCSAPGADPNIERCHDQTDLVRERCEGGFDPDAAPAGARGVRIGVDMGRQDATPEALRCKPGSQKEAGVALGKAMKRLTKPVDELDREALGAYCDGLGVTPMDRITPRTPTRVAGEIRAVRIVPRAGSPSLEATITDGTGSIVVVWTGRRKIAGVTPGKRLVVSGRGAATGPRGRLLMFNPSYELL